MSKLRAAGLSPGPRQPPSELRLCNGKTRSSHSMPRLLTHQAQLGLPPAAWCGDSLAPTLAFPMMPFKIQHVPSLGPSINNIPPPGAAREPGVPGTGHPTLDGTCPRNRVTMADTLAPWNQGVPSFTLRVLWVGACPALPQEWGLGPMKPWVSFGVQGHRAHLEDTTFTIQEAGHGLNGGSSAHIPYILQLMSHGCLCAGGRTLPLRLGAESAPNTFSEECVK